LSAGKGFGLTSGMESPKIPLADNSKKKALRFDLARSSLTKSKTGSAIIRHTEWDAPLSFNTPVNWSTATSGVSQINGCNGAGLYQLEFKRELSAVSYEAGHN
jgi:hypothetical protein